MTGVLRSADDPTAVAQAAEALASGAVVAIPTDTVYGIAADPSQPQAVQALFALKDRPEGVAVALLLADVDQARQLTDALASGPARRLAERFWPGPLTLVVDRRPGVSFELGGEASSIGLRVPAHDAVRALAAAAGPLAVTSANRHGDPTPSTAAEVARGVAASGLLVLDGGRCAGDPSTVVDVRGGQVEVLRAGRLPVEKVYAVLAE